MKLYTNQVTVRVYFYFISKRKPRQYEKPESGVFQYPLKTDESHEKPCQNDRNIV